MKKVLKVIAWLLGIALLIVAGVAAWINFSALPTYDPPAIPELTVEVTPERVAQGAKIASMQCVICHTGSDGKLSGQILKDSPKAFGKFYSANITKHPDRGIGKWTDGEIYYFLRTSLRKDGRFATPAMPKFPKAADEDLYSVIAWLRSDDQRLEPSDKGSHPQELTFLAKALMKFVFRPYPFPTQPIALADTTNAVEWGRYLATGLYGCYDCHSADFATNNALEPEKSVGFFGGGNPMLDMEGNVMPSANITPDPETGIGSWTEEQFVQTVKHGRRPDGTAIRYPMLPHTPLTDGEVKAIYAYLRTVPPIKNKVERPAFD